jgi:hypothetical protein
VLGGIAMRDTLEFSNATAAQNRTRSGAREGARIAIERGDPIGDAVLIFHRNLSPVAQAA